MKRLRPLCVLAVLTALAMMLIAAGCGKPEFKASVNWKVQDFNFIDQEGRPLGLDDLRGSVWLADFIFTHCYTVCPPMTMNMALLQQKLKENGADVKIVSFTVDPERDTPEVLKNYGMNYHADFSNWYFLTGYTQEEIQTFSVESFKSIVQNEKGTDQVIHGTSFFLVDPAGTVVKRYDGAADPPFEQIISDVKALLASH